MSLKTAKMFKMFTVVRTADNLTFGMYEPIDVKVKNDNFATQIQIYDADGSIDFFEYKYITFDQHAFFEITDCIINGKYATLFIQYVSNITFGTPTSNYEIKAQTVQYLSQLGLDFSEILQIMGDQTTQREIYQNAQANDAPFNFALKIRLSEIPQNLKRGLNGKGNPPYINIQNPTKRGDNGSMIFNPVDYGITPNSKAAFRSFDNAISLFLIIPNTPIVYFNFGADGTSTGVYNLAYSMQDMLSALDALISDLTLSVEITIVNNQTFYMCDGASIKNIPITQTGAQSTQVTIATSTAAQTATENLILKWIRLIDDIDVPVIMTQCDQTYGIWESMNIIYVPLYNLLTTANGAEYGKYILTGMRFLGNLLDLSMIPQITQSSSLFFKRDAGSILIYYSMVNAPVIKIDTTFEYAKNAYSNYNAYIAANVDLSNRQNNDALKLQQKQQREMQNIDTAMNVVNTIGNTVKGGLQGFMSGGVVGAIAGAGSNLINGAIKTGMDELQFNMEQQNARANAKLAAEQAHERAAKTIVPSSDISGSIKSQTFFKSTANFKNGYLFSLIFCPFTTKQTLKRIAKYIFENSLTTDINTPNGQKPIINRPSWLANIFQYYQVKFVSTDPRNTHKDFTVYVFE